MGEIYEGVEARMARIILYHPNCLRRSAYPRAALFPFALIMSLFLFSAIAALSGLAAAEPISMDKLAGQRNSFTLEQHAVPRRHIWTPPQRMARTYQKYGVPVPFHIKDAMAAYANGSMEDTGPGESTVPVVPVKGDVEYLINVTVGNHQLALDMDTGSSDL